MLNCLNRLACVMMHSDFMNKPLSLSFCLLFYYFLFFPQAGGQVAHLYSDWKNNI